MPLYRVVEQTKQFVSNRINSERFDQFISEFDALISDLVSNPHLPKKRQLITLLKRYGIEEAVATKLTQSLALILSQSSAVHEPNTEIRELDFPNIKSDPLLLEKIKQLGKQYSRFPDEHLLSILKDAAIPLASLVGSNIAEALALKDPQGVILAQGLSYQALRGELLDAVSISEEFGELSDSQRATLTRLIGDKITQVKEIKERMKENILREGKTHQWMFDKLKENGFTSQIAKKVIPILAKKYSVDDIDEWNPRQFRQKVVDCLN